MGFFEKRSTAKRVAPIAVPIAPAFASTPWVDRGAVVLGSLARGAGWAMDMRGMSSSAFRGETRTILGFSPFLSRQSSHLWIQAPSFDTWQFILGVPNREGGIAADWIVQVTVDGDFIAHITTKSYTTVDDDLVHVVYHEPLLQRIVDAVSTGTSPDLGRDASIGAAALSEPQRFEVPALEPFALDFAFVTALTAAEILPKLSQLGFRTLPDAAPRLRFGLGLPANGEFDYAAVDITDGGLACSARVGSPTAAGRRMATTDLRVFIDRLTKILRIADPTSNYQGPPEWSR